jgi:Bacteriophage replication protein O
VENKNAQSKSVELWELDVISEVASTFRTSDPAELRAELARKVLELKQKDLSHVETWRGYLRWYVGVKAIDFVKAERKEANCFDSLDAPLSNDDESGTLLDTLLDGEPEIDSPLLSEVDWSKLTPEQRDFCRVMIEEDFSHDAVAKRRGWHRNTVGAWIKKIRATGAFDSGARPSLKQPKSVAMNNAEVEPFVRLPNRLMDALLANRFTLVEMKIILWVIRNTIGWNKPATPFTWYRIAAELGVDRAGVFRAGKRLAHSGMVTIKGTSIAIQADPAQWKLEKAMTGVNVDKRHRKASTGINGSDDKRQPKRRQASSLFRRTKDSKDRKTYKDSARAKSVDERQRRQTAGEAHPVEGKYDDLTSQ